jgi:hypothetical protein
LEDYEEQRKENDFYFSKDLKLPFIELFVIVEGLVGCLILNNKNLQP